MNPILSEKDLLEFIQKRKESIAINKNIFEEKGITSVSIETYLEVQRALLSDIEKLLDKE